MIGKRCLFSGFLAIAAVVGTECAQAGDITITIPRHSKLTPVQRLNREGVEAVRKHDYSKAERLFYKAYLYDPEDAFTLNNLGYISELQGQVDRAQGFYTLAAEQSSDAVVDLASPRRVQGQTMREALAVTNGPLQLNHANVEAVRLLGQGRAPEADLLLQGALKSNPNNIFTLNNMGVAKEMEGEDQDALKYFDQASAGDAGLTAVVTTNRVWRGRPVADMARENAKNLRERLAREKDFTEQVAGLNLRGVSAINRNDLRSADTDFRKAYAIDPQNAFTLNNIGYVAELEGDRETAEFFYDRARHSAGASATVGVATRQTAEGRKLFAVADDSDGRVAAKVAQERAALQQLHEPVLLHRRDGSVVDESSPPAPTPGITPQ